MDMQHHRDQIRNRLCDIYHEADEMASIYPDMALDALRHAKESVEVYMKRIETIKERRQKGNE